MKITTRERRDWTLLIFIIPIGIIFMMIAGQIAIRIVPQWSVNAGMQSQLDPATAPKQQVGFVQPVLPEILTPLGWLETFLTPNSDSGDDIAFPPFIVLEPTATPSPTNSPTASPTATETVTTTVSPSPTVVTTVPSATPTKKPPVDTDTPSPTATTPSPTATTPSPTATATATAPPPITSTIDPSLTVVPPPIEIGDTPDGNFGNINPGTYVVIDISANPIYVGITPDDYYDFVYYEWNNGGNIYFDSVVLGISQWADLTLPGSLYYEVFNWGDNIPDTNTNMDTNDLPPDPACDGSPTAPECDNRIIPDSELHPNPGAGILIDVDNASSLPPTDTYYNYLVIISPNTVDNDSVQVDAIEVTEVPIPTPTP